LPLWDCLSHTFSSCSRSSGTNALAFWLIKTKRESWLKRSLPSSPLAWT
jgi:hypothetical protein